MLKRIDHINAVVRDLPAAKKFFVELGFTVKREGELEGEWIENLADLRDVKAAYAALGLPGDAASLELLSFRSPANQEDEKLSKLNSPGFRHLAFEVRDIDSVVSKLQNKGIEFLSPVQTYETTGKKLCYFRGPEGLFLELAEYKKEK